MDIQPTIHILLATYNGERYLRQQLDSIAHQTYNSWTLTVSDDESTDNTKNIVSDFSNELQQPIKIIRGPKRASPTDNFFSLIYQAPTKNPLDLYAFCDQDDVWLHDKLERAAKWHVQHQKQEVRLYCGRTQFVDEKLRHISYSPLLQHSPKFENALIQNIASGNTMVFSHSLLLALQKVHQKNSIWHDWTTYIVTTAMSGIVFYDNKPCLLYRQHADNFIGANTGAINAILNIPNLLNGRLRIWAETNYLAVKDLNYTLSPENSNILNQFEELLSSQSGRVSLIIYIKSKLRRGNLFSNLAFGLAILIGLF